MRRPGISGGQRLTTGGCTQGSDRRRVRSLLRIAVSVWLWIVIIVIAVVAIGYFTRGRMSR
jgi:hypothetical protein